MSVKSLGEINITVNGVHVVSVESAVRATCLLDTVKNVESFKKITATCHFWFDYA